MLKLLVMNFYCGPEIRGKQGCNGRGLGISGSNWRFHRLWGDHLVDNYLLFSPNHSTFHSSSTGRLLFEDWQGSTWGLDHRLWITLWMSFSEELRPW